MTEAPAPEPALLAVVRGGAEDVEIAAVLGALAAVSGAAAGRRAAAQAAASATVDPWTLQGRQRAGRPDRTHRWARTGGRLRP